MMKREELGIEREMCKVVVKEIRDTTLKNQERETESIERRIINGVKFKL